jgi:Flp pilus assembly protein TadG
MKLVHLLEQYLRERRGTAAVEYVFWLAALSAPIFGAADIGYYGYQVIQAHNAAQMAVQAAFAACASTTNFPATKRCGSKGATLNAAIANGEGSSSLGATAHMTSGKEQWLCETSTGLKDFDSGNEDGTIATTTTAGVTDVDNSGSGNSSPATFPPSTTPFDCTAFSSTETQEPGDYIVVTISHTFHPLFKGFSVVNLLGGSVVTINQTVYTRLE